MKENKKIVVKIGEIYFMNDFWTQFQTPDIEPASLRGGETSNTRIIDSEFLERLEKAFNIPTMMLTGLYESIYPESFMGKFISIRKSAPKSAENFMMYAKLEEDQKGFMDWLIYWQKFSLEYYKNPCVIFQYANEA